jgi:two-component sensor histidine kinase
LSGTGKSASGRRKRPNVPRRRLTDKIAKGDRATVLLDPTKPSRRSIMKIESMSAPDPALGAAPLMLVGEISHRVLNEYTAAIATLAIARARTADLTARNALAAAERRLLAQAAVHRALRPPPAGQPCNLGDYLIEVCSALSCASLQDRGVRLTLAPENIALAPDRCWRVALIVAELVNNAVRHAFSGQSGWVLVEVQVDGPTICCCVSDNGRSSSGEPLPGLGRSIVKSLAEALGGVIAWRFDPTGTQVILEIPADPTTLA